MAQANTETNINQMVGLFLAEVIRSRKTSLKRAAEICRRVVPLLSGVKSEGEALMLLVSMEKDFEEINILKQALNFGGNPARVELYENEIKQYAASFFQQDMVASSQFLQDAAESVSSIQELCIKYPDFCNFLLTSTDKKELMKAFSFQ